MGMDEGWKALWIKSIYKYKTLGNRFPAGKLILKTATSNNLLKCSVLSKLIKHLGKCRDPPPPLNPAVFSTQ